jgi:CTP:molybdopterin cytidylyltransferase MocA
MDYHGAQVRVIEADADGPLMDIDTPEDLEKAQQPGTPIKTS